MTFPESIFQSTQEVRPGSSSDIPIGGGGTQPTKIQQKKLMTRWWQLKYVFFSPLFGEDEPHLTSIFFRWDGWNHQPDEELAELMAYTAESIVFGYFGLTAVAYTSEVGVLVRGGYEQETYENHRPTGRSWDKDPIGSMYGVFTYIWLKSMVNVGKYTIHGSYGDVIFCNLRLKILKMKQIGEHLICQLFPRVLFLNYTRHRNGTFPQKGSMLIIW